MSEPLYSTKTPFLKSISDSVSREDRTWAIRWSLKEIEKPIRRLRKKYPWYTTPTDCKRLGELFICYYLTALKMDGASDREIEKEAERMTLSYERKQNG